MYVRTRFFAVLALAVLGGAVSAQTPTTQPADTEEAGAGMSRIAAIVDGETIMESEVREVFKDRVARDPRAQQMPEAQLDRIYETQARRQFLKMLVDRELMESQIEKTDIEVSEEEYRAEAEKQVQNFLAARGLERDEYAKQHEEAYGKTLKETLEEQAKDPAFRSMVEQFKYIEKRFPEDIKVTEEEVKARYERDLERNYSKPEQVRASHILIKTEGMDDEQKEEARKKAEELLEKVKKPETEFAKLATEHSDCPSAQRGGDLNWFGRQRMVKPFADAAFAMKVGEISDVVETSFGYHIIKVTDRREAKVTPLEEAKDAIRRQLKNEKLNKVRAREIEKLREKAEIVYPEDSEKSEQPRPTTQPAEAPAVETD